MSRPQNNRRQIWAIVNFIVAANFLGQIYLIVKICYGCLLRLVRLMNLVDRIFGLSNTAQSQNFTMSFPKAPTRSVDFRFNSEQKFILLR